LGVRWGGLKDPVEALVSRYGWGHCRHIQGDCGAAEAQWPKLDRYAVNQVRPLRRQSGEAATPSIR